MPEKNIHRIKVNRIPGNPSVWALAGFIGSLLLTGGVAGFLLTEKLIPWPFHGAETVCGTYGRILVYLPFTGFSLLSVFWIKGKKFWIKGEKRPVADFIKWNRFSPTFYAGLVFSAGYTLYLFLSHNFAYKGMAFVPPALILGLLNAVSEEFLFRLVLFQLIVPLTESWHRANLMQAVLYGAVHLFIGGPVFFLGAVGYGLLLGWIFKTNDSIIPAIICHFIADVGAIGLPLLILV